MGLRHTILYHWLKLLMKGRDLGRLIIEWIAQRWLFDNKTWIEVLVETQTTLSQEKQARIDCVTEQQQTIYFTFREYHFLDWFLPIHQRLEKVYPGKYAVFYIDFGASLRNVGNRLAYWQYQRKIIHRLLKNNTESSHHFSDQEIHLYKNFPTPDLIITSETIRKENFNAGHRVYLPHYCVPKAKDTLPQKIAYEHVFLPSRPPYTYAEITTEKTSAITIHEVGYPKIHGSLSSATPRFDDGKKLVIYAPSLEPELVLKTLKEGILNVFDKMADLNFIVKLHPTLSSKMRNSRRLIEKQINRSTNIVLDSQSSIQDLGIHSSALITDFGSVGAEYRLQFSKRVIYLKVPRMYEGGGDLLFRDRFADGITHVKGLKSTIRKVIEKGDLTPSERDEMRIQVLFEPEKGDTCAAQQINAILSESSVKNRY